MPFSRTTLLLRTLRHFRAANLAVVAGMAVATAVLTGALMVGDSVRGSLRDLAENRLGFVDHAMMSPRFLDQSLATRLAQTTDFKQRFDSITPGITVRGGAARGDGKARTPGVQITALADRFSVNEGESIINPTLAQALGGQVSAIRFSLPAPEETPRDATLARRSRNDIIATLTVEKSSVAEKGAFLDLFNLAATQRESPSAWVNLKSLQDELDRAEQVNLFLVAAKTGHQSQDDAKALNESLRQIATLPNYGLDLQKSADKSETVIASKSTYIHPAIVKAAEEVAGHIEKLISFIRMISAFEPGPLAPVLSALEAGWVQPHELRRVSVYLVNTVAKNSEPGTRNSELHYAIAAGISDLAGAPLATNEIAVNQWTADQMNLKIGDTLRLDYYLRQPNGDLAEVRSDRPGLGLTFKVAKILPMSGLGADPTLTPAYKGLTDADTIADWRPPAGLEINKKLVTKADEQYWGKYKAAPKIFLSLDTATKLWGNAFGDVTSLRVPNDKSAAFQSALLKEIDPATLGMIFRPVRAQQVAASSGSTDFGELFGGFSCFLLAAAVILVAMLFRLGVEQRARQLGLLAASGFSPGKIRALCLLEGFILALVGGALGLALALAYTALMIHGLRTWWVGAIGTTALRLHVRPLTLLTGFFESVIIAMLAIAWAVRRVAKTSPSALLAGALGSARIRLTKPPRISIALGLITALIAIALFAAAAKGKAKPEEGFLGGGAMLLTAALLLTFARLRPRHHATASLSIPTLALRNATRNRTRSLLCVALIALASFTLVTVSSMESATPRNTFDRKSGAGGYALIVETDIPLLADLNTLEGRQLLMRQASAKDPRWNNAKFAMMRSWAGQDISCLNITRPDSPKILAVPKSMMQPDRFTFASKIKDAPNPWDLLNEPRDDPNTIPVIADDESAQYILKLKIGDAMPLTDAAGRPRKLKLVATLAGSIFQSEMLMSEPNFHKLFPAQSGFSTILVETAPDNDPSVIALLSETLNDEKDQEKSDYSASIQTTAARLDAYHEVANTYLATFRVLGSLGLMLGTIGLAVVLVRNLIERRPELALMTALGFDLARRTRLVLWENISLLLLGLLIGAGCALAGVIPNVLTTSHHINIPALSLALAAVLLVGITSLLIAVRLAGRKISPAALRAE
jgi:putative ABC transport system permease protein